MNAQLLKEIIKNIHNNKSYKTEVNGVKKDLTGADFKTEIITKYKKISDADAKILLDSLKGNDVKADDAKEVEKIKKTSKKTEDDGNL